MTPGRRRQRVVAFLLAAPAALLLLASVASAETRVGESSTVIRENFPAAEVTLVKADASYESAAGSVVFHVTTAAGPNLKSEGENAIVAALTTTTECSGQRSGTAIARALFEHPIFGVGDTLAGAATGLIGNFLSPQNLPATRVVEGTTATLSVASGLAANKEYNCAIIVATESGEEGGGEIDEEFPSLEEKPGATYMSFPIAVPPPPAAPATAGTAPAPSPSPAPAKAPPALKMAKLKPLALKAGRWGSVKVKVTNTGATATALGSLRVKTARGVLVKPERQQLPVLAPGASWTMTVRVQLGPKAKSRSTLSLTAAASGVSATGPLVLKAKG
jgi:hypothetical protein